MYIFDEWKSLVANTEGIFWIQQKNKHQTIITGSGDKIITHFDDTESCVFTVTNFKGTECRSWSFEQVDSFVLENKELKTGNTTQKQPINYKFQTTKEKFVSKVNQVKKLAQNGELWVLNLAIDIIFPDLTDKQIFMAFSRWLHTKSDKVGSIIWTDKIKFISFSPETFITQQSKKISTFPIKGTGSQAYLKSSDKEISELNMITDLLRNDLGQIAKKVTVPRSRFMTDHGYFWHTQAEITADLGRNLTWKDYQALLPAGSISGAPKKRVVQFIEKLEDFDREFFTGTFSVRASDKDLQSSILIRTFFKRDDMWYFPIGVGITHLSDPEAEWDEIQQKLDGVLRFF